MAKAVGGAVWIKQAFALIMAQCIGADARKTRSLACAQQTALT